MITKELIAKINALALKKKTTGLTPAEEEEQKKLRAEYLASFKENFRTQVEGLKIVDEHGNDVTPDKLKEVQKEKGIHGRHPDEA